MFFCGGGPDENLRFPKSLDFAIQYFQKFNLDALLISAHTLGLSTYNQVERRVATLSKALSGVLLLHETFVTHLDSLRKTIDTNLEKHNFKAAGLTTSLLRLMMLKMLQKIPKVCMRNGPACTAEFLSTYHKLFDAMIQSVVVSFKQLGRVFSQVTFYQLLFQ